MKGLASSEFATRTCILLIPLLLAGCDGGTPVPLSREARIAWLDQHANPVRTVDPVDTDYSDLEPLRAILGDSRIVMLGEQSHGDGPVFLAKTRLIQFLHEEMGFDVLAFESGLYDCAKANDLLQQGLDPVESIRTGVFAIWTRAEEFVPLMKYVGARVQSDRPLTIAGFDMQFTGSASQKYFLSDLATFMQRSGIDTLSLGDWHEFRVVMDGLIKGVQFQDKDKPDSATRIRVFAILDTLASIMVEQPQSDEAAFWLQVVRSARSNAKWIWESSWDSNGQLASVEDVNPRDEQMANNLLWLANHRYPGKKIVVWAATFHIMRNAQSVVAIDTIANRPYTELVGDTGRDYAHTLTMGSQVRDAVGDQSYALGFTAYDGKSGGWFVPEGRARDIPTPPANSIEELLAQTDHAIAIVDYRTSTAHEWLREPLVSNPLNNTPMIARWPDVLDGIMYIRTQGKATRATS